MNKYAQVLGAIFLLTASSFAFAQTGACNENPAPGPGGSVDKCWCDSGQAIGSCFNRLGERGEVPFPVSWNISEPGQYQGWSFYIDTASNVVNMYYQGQLQGTQTVSVINGDKYRFRDDVQGDYLLSGSTMFDAFGGRFQLQFEANQIGYKTGQYTMTKRVCMNGLCYASN